MGCFSGPEIITNSLVLAYDQGNTDKSWKGKPATNFITNGHFSGGNGVTQESGSNATNEVIVFRNPGNSEYVLRQTGTVAFTEYQINLTTQLVASTTYVLSGWYAESPDYSSADGSRMFHSRAYSTSGASVTLGIGIGTVLETRIVNGITWKYCYATITTPADYNNVFEWYLGYGGSAYTGYRYYTNLQVEVGTLPSRFVNGTRSNTQAILDLTGQNTITASSLTYNSNGSFSFNGTSDYIDTNNKFTFAKSSQFSAEVWLKILDHSDRPAAAAGILGKGHYYDNGWDIWLYNNNAIYFETSGDPTRQGLIYLETPVLTLSTWYHYVATYNNGAKSVYLNGTLVGTQTYTGPGDFSNTNNVLIGRRFNDSSRSLRGEISLAKIYNRALSAAEVLQNFNAHRGRFGL